MNKPSEQNPSTGPAKTGDLTQPNPGERIQDPRETAQEKVHQVTPRDAIKTPAQDDVKPPLQATKGDGASR